MTYKIGDILNNPFAPGTCLFLIVGIKPMIDREPIIFYVSYKEKEFKSINLFEYLQSHNKGELKKLWAYSVEFSGRGWIYQGNLINQQRKNKLKNIYNKNPHYDKQLF